MVARRAGRFLALDDADAWRPGAGVVEARVSWRTSPVSPTALGSPTMGSPSLGSTTGRGGDNGQWSGTLALEAEMPRVR